MIGARQARTRRPTDNLMCVFEPGAVFVPAVWVHCTGL